MISVLTYGHEIWKLDEKVERKLKGWCARCLANITGRSIRDETVEPSFDLLSRLRSRRLRWAGHILRLEETSLIRRMLLATVERDLEAGNRHAGGLLSDAPVFESVEQLLELAGDRNGWRDLVKALLPDSDPAVVAKARNKKKAHKAAELQKEGKKHQVSDAFTVGAGYHLVEGIWILAETEEF